MLVRVALAIFFAAVCRVGAQEALSEALPSPAEITPQPLPESAWLDLRQNAPRNSKTQNAPAWVEALTLLPGEATEGGGTSKSIFRIRVAQPSPDYHVLFFRLFFDDKPNQQPELIAWDESGTHILRSGALGVGMNLPSSDSVLIPMTAPALHAPPEDVENFGTVTATLAADPIRIDGETQENAVFQFPIEAQPLTALLTFEIANPAIDAAPEIFVNGQDIGPVSLTLPELADPGYRGEMEPLTTQMRFHYTGWLRAQKILPATALKVGPNDLVIANGVGSGSSAIRATQIQLKYIWDKSDYLLHTSR